MSNNCLSLYKEKSQQYATTVIQDPIKEKYFLDGVKWAVQVIEERMKTYSHPMANASDNAMLKEFTWSDLKRAIKELKEST